MFRATNALKVLSFLADNPAGEFLSGEIQKATGISRTGVFLGLKELVGLELVTCLKKGRFMIYALKRGHPVNKQFKVLRNVMLLKGVLAKLEPIAQKVTLFGSSARGEDYADSDIDLFVLASDKDIAAKIISSTKLSRKIQPIIKTPVEWAEFKQREKVFSSEIDRGIILWEKSQ